MVPAQLHIIITYKLLHKHNLQPNRKNYDNKWRNQINKYEFLIFILYSHWI